MPLSPTRYRQSAMHGRIRYGRCGLRNEWGNLTQAARLCRQAAVRPGPCLVAARQTYRTSQSTLLDLGAEPFAEGAFELLNAGGGVNWMAGFFGTITGGCVTFAV